MTSANEKKLKALRKRIARRGHVVGADIKAMLELLAGEPGSVEQAKEAKRCS